MKSQTACIAKSLALIAGLLIAGTVAADKLYKWTDKDGKVHYTDQPPSAATMALERKSFGDKPNAVPLPYSLRRPMKNFPVTLYKTDCGEACTEASAFLTQRGVPFTEKNPRDAAIAEELKALTGGKLEVPVIKIGSLVILGYEQGSWKTALDAAGYPSSPVTPVRAATAAPKPVAPVAAKPEAPVAAKPEAPAAAKPEAPVPVGVPAQAAPTERGAALH